MKLAVIPARGGSKRIPRKNIKEFNGQPMIAYSIQAALKAGCFDRIIVSTDDSEIANLSKDYGAEVPFIRPEELSGDFVATTPVIKHAVHWAESQGLWISSVCCIYATAPFIQSNMLLEALEYLENGRASYCFSATPYRFPIQRAVRLNGDRRVEMFMPEHFLTRSQDLEEAYHDAGQFYWGTASAWKNEAPIFAKHSTVKVLPSYLVQDIDTPEDWQRAELMHRILKDQGVL